MLLQEIALINLHIQMVKKLEAVTDPYGEDNFSSIKNFVMYTRKIKKTTRKEYKAIAKAIKNVPLTRYTKDRIKSIRYKMKAIRFDLRLIIDYVISKQPNLKKIEDRFSIRNIIIKNFNEDYGDD